MKRKTAWVALICCCALLCATLPALAEEESLAGAWNLIAMSEMTLTEKGDTYAQSEMAILPSTASGNIFTLGEDGTVAAEGQYLNYIPAPLRDGATWTQAGNDENVTWFPCLNMDLSNMGLFTIDDFSQEGIIVCETPEGPVHLQYKIYAPNGTPTLCIQQNTPLEPEGGNARTRSIATYFRRK